MVTHSYYTASITGTPYKWVRISGHFSLPITSPAICYGLIIHNCVFFSNFFQILFSRIAIALPSYSSRRSKLTLMVKKFDRVCVNGNKKPVYRLLYACRVIFTLCIFCTSFTCKGFRPILNSPRQDSFSCVNRPVFNSPADKGKRGESIPVYSNFSH